MRSYPLHITTPVSPLAAVAGPTRCPRRRWAISLVTISSTLAAALAALSTAPANASPETVTASGYDAGTIVVRTNERRLYYYIGNGRALRYRVGVGKTGQQWSGTSYISGKYLSPAWKPPADIRREKPGLPDVVSGGSSKNPMGVAAMTLAGGQYAIHGTNRPSSIGGFVSHGCIRMYNEDVTDLYSRVSTNTPVVVTE